VELTRLVLPRLAREPHAQVDFVTSSLALTPKSSSPVYCAILDGVAKRRAEIDVGATALLRLIKQLSPSLGEPIMIGR
jgi:hypothetical protein